MILVPCARHLRSDSNQHATDESESLGTVDLPLRPLSRGDPVTGAKSLVAKGSSLTVSTGSFPLVSSDGQENGRVDISMYWTMPYHIRGSIDDARYA